MSVDAVEIRIAQHDHCRVGAPVPSELYGAVAVVIAFTMRLDARHRMRRVHDLADVELPDQWQEGSS